MLLSYCSHLFFFFLSTHKQPATQRRCRACPCRCRSASSYNPLSIKSTSYLRGGSDCFGYALTGTWTDSKLHFVDVGFSPDTSQSRYFFLACPICLVYDTAHSFAGYTPGLPATNYPASLLLHCSTFIIISQSTEISFPVTQHTTREGIQNHTQIASLAITRSSYHLRDLAAPATPSTLITGKLALLSSSIQLFRHSSFYYTISNHGAKFDCAVPGRRCSRRQK